MSYKKRSQQQAKRSRDGVVQRYIRERDQALDKLKVFTQQVNAHVGTAYNMLAASLGYEFKEDVKKYDTGGRDLITLVLEVINRHQDLDPTAPKIVERRDAPVEYEKKERVILSAVEDSAEVDERTAIQEETGDTSFDAITLEHRSKLSKEAFTESESTSGECVKHETAYEAMAEIATEDAGTGSDNAGSAY